MLEPRFRLETVLEDVGVGEDVDVGEDVEVGEAVPVLTELAVWLGGVIDKEIMLKVPL